MRPGNPFAFALIAALVLPSSSCGPAFEEPRVVQPPVDSQRMQLANGLVVVLQPDSTVQDAHVLVRYHVGSKDDPPGQNGLAHLAEHLMFAPTSRTTPRDFNQMFDAHGAIGANGSTSWDATDFHEATSAGAIEAVLWLEAARMASPLELVDESVLERERHIVINELRERHDDAALGGVYDAVSKALFGDKHPYGRPVGGTLESTKHIDLEAVRLHASQFYRPNDATVVVTGRFDAATVKSSVTSFFGRIPPGTEAPHTQVPPPAITRETRLDMRAAVESRAVVFAWAAPPASDPERVLLELGLDGLRRRLARALPPKGLVGVEAGFTGGRLASLAAIVVQIRDSITADEAISAFERVADNMRSLGRAFNPWFDFPFVKTRHKVNVLASITTPGGRGHRVMDDLEHRGTTDALRDELRTVDQADANVVAVTLATRVLDTPRVTVVVEPDPNAPPMGVLRGHL